MLEVATIEPPPPCTIVGSTPRQLMNTPVRFTAMTRFQSASAIAGPGASLFANREVIAIPRPSPAGLWKASQSITALSREEMFAVEPLYLQGSSAEEKRAQSAKTDIASARVS